MNAILIPVKTFAESKKRLAAHFSAVARESLAMALCSDFFRTVVKLHEDVRIFVVSQEPLALAWAQENGWETIVETRQTSESQSVDFASHMCTARGVTALLRIPIDIPLVEASDIETLFAERKYGPSMVIVPSRDGTGTNALLRSPPTLFPSHFGPNSFSMHLAEAEKANAQVKIARNAHIELDIDELDDLRALAEHVRKDTATGQWMEKHLS